MEHLLVTRVAQEGTALSSGSQGFEMARQPTALGNPLANFQAPMRVQIVHHPVEPFHERELGCNVIEMANPVDTGPGRSQVPNDLAGGDAEGGQQGPRPVTDILELPLLEVAGSGGSRGILPLEDLHPRLLVAGKDQPTLLVETWSIEVQLADILGFGIEVRIVTVEPILAAMGFQIGIGQNTLDGAAAHLPMMNVSQNLEGQIVERPGGVGLLMFFGLATGQIDDLQTFGGGKSSGVGRSGERLGDQRGRG